MAKIVAFTGPSNSGKTTVIEKIAKILTSNFKVAIIKHDPKDKAVFDISGKDSFKFFATGANVAVISPTRTTIFKREEENFNQTIKMLEPFDYLLVEGLKWLDLPRIGVFRQSFDECYLSYIKAVAVDDTVLNLPPDIDRLDLNNPEEILTWINKFAKEI